MTTWITGCAGFLGGRLSRAFTAAGHQVIGLSRRPSENVATSVSIDLASAGAVDRLRRLCDEAGAPELVIHAAALTADKSRPPAGIDANVLTTITLVRALDVVALKQIINISTLNVYGQPASNPVKEGAALLGTSWYACTKIISERIVNTFSDRTQVVTLRLPSLFGAGQADSFIDGLAKLALSDAPIELYGRGEIGRDALHVDDVVRAIQRCAAAPPSGRRCCLNLGCGQRITTVEYAEALVAALDSESRIVPVDRNPAGLIEIYAEIDEARRHIGFAPTDLAESMTRYAEELLSERQTIH